MSQFTTWVSSHIKGDEKGEAQIFLDRLFKGFGHEGWKEAGATCEERVKSDTGGTSFADLVWKPRVVIEMKKRGANLNKHYSQAFTYWTYLVPNRPRYAVLCNFDEFWVYDFETQMDTPVEKIKLAELPKKYGALNFLFPGEVKPVFGNHHEEVTREAADKLATCFNYMIDRKVERGLAQRFILQILMAFFAEDIGLLDKYLVKRLLDECESPQDSYDIIGGLFEAMNRPEGNQGGRYKGVDYFNGGLFAQPAKIELDTKERILLKEACDFDWSKVRPEIFGTLFEHSLGKKQRHASGAHFTTPVDIMKIVGPTIVEPWRDAIERSKTLTEMQALAHRMQTFTVLDPACGSGNFLFTAYRELKRLEAALYARMAERFPRSVDPKQRSLGFVTTTNFYGMDVNSFAVEIAKVTMMLAHKLSIDELHVSESALPLDNLDRNILHQDALITADGQPTPWPKADVIVGNPPYLGAKNLKRDLPADYVNRVRKAYQSVPKMADLCVYWFYRANEELADCTKADRFKGRAGLVGTQNIRANASRRGGLDYIVESGTLVEAVENQPWSGEAEVNVSIANWVKSKDETLLPTDRRLWFVPRTSSVKKARASRGEGPTHKRYELDMRLVSHISSALSDKTDVSGALTLDCNRNPQRAFQGVTPGYNGFVLRPDAATALLAKEPGAQDLLRSYMIGRELNSTGKSTRYIIDAYGLDLTDLASYPKTLAHLQRAVLPKVQEKVKTERAKASDMVKAREDHLERWWTFWAQRTELRAWLAGRKRVIAASRTQRAPFLFHFVSTDLAHGDKLQLFAFDDDYSFGILQSHPHCLWYDTKGTRLKNEVDVNYSSDEVFATFPWPQSPSKTCVNEVAGAARNLRAVRSATLKGGATLRSVYGTLAMPGKSALKEAHAALDAAVIKAYGFSARKDCLGQLLALNQQVAAMIKACTPVTGPGIPDGYSTPATLVSNDSLG
ncbi:DNA methyltransferase [Cupriavidus taiwanensis]|uniref:DNA methyltransferase n=1 Tax=Cupriavidus taiwanensis TaxID=164546 RepID=UPI0018DAF720|nr:DNA methyltransferase [Cupriavidus taiwanensis]